MCWFVRFVSSCEALPLMNWKWEMALLNQLPCTSAPGEGHTRGEISTPVQLRHQMPYWGKSFYWSQRVTFFSHSFDYIILRGDDYLQYVNCALVEFMVGRVDSVVFLVTQWHSGKLLPSFKRSHLHSSLRITNSPSPAGALDSPLHPYLNRCCLAERLSLEHKRANLPLDSSLFWPAVLCHCS